ncbi:hypothetical protein KFU94_68915 [Chloroflexi bacterium TSY]|nr:hypothetical protein [Chloroflexi bacterium TSY]
MNIFLIVVILLIGLLFSAMSSAIFADSVSSSSEGDAPIPITATTISSTYAATAPRLDGVLDFGEWPTADSFQFDGGWLAVRNDDLRLYILINLLEDTTADEPLATAPWGDRVWLTIDVDRDGEITNDNDLRYALVPGTYNMRQQYYLGPGTWRQLQLEASRSGFATDFDCFFADESRSVSVLPDFPFPIVNCSPHRIWEFGIDLAEINVKAGEIVHLGLSVSSQNPSFTRDIPANLHYDFSNLVKVALAAASGSAAPADPNATIDFQTERFAASIEVTQAVQDHANSLPLVEAKSTVARLYLEVSGTDSPQPTKVYLYGRRQGQELSGSPLSMLFLAPTTVDQSQLNQTANFLLPDSWLQGDVEFQGRIVDAFDNEAWSTTISLSFRPTIIPTYWIVPVNTSTVEEPVVIDEAEIAQQESYLRTIFPVPDVNFVRKGWQEVGAFPSTNLSANISQLKRYDRDTQIAWYSSLQETGVEPFVLPDAIYGIRLDAGGLSDPIWNGGGGRVAVGGERASSQEGTMAHELIHILDTSRSGSWGRHAPGCNASGIDPQWPYIDEKVQTIGFDTRLPWSSGTTVVSAGRSDLMSYCFSFSPPTKWISPYRWSRLFDAFANAGSVVRASSIKRMQADMETVLYISGEVRADGAGHLEPILVQPGIPTGNIVPGDYAIEIRDASGTSLRRTSFLVSFEDAEGKKLEMIRFSLRLPQEPEAAQFLLLHGEQMLDSIMVSAHAPTVTVLAPNGGEMWDGLQTIRWKADDQDGDSLLFSALYSPDDGRRWLPIAGNLSGESHSVDTRVLPGGGKSRIRLIATDGFNTSSDDSDATFDVAKKSPQVVIQRPQTRSRYASGELISLSGQANDLEDRTIPERSFTWSYGSTIFASGRQASAVLPNGIHEVTLTVIDSDGSRGKDSITISVGLYQSYLPLIHR